MTVEPPPNARAAWARLLGLGGGHGGEGPRPNRRWGRRGSQAVVALLCAVLGFALATQVRTNSAQEGGLANARQEDLVRILDDLSARSDRLRSEISDLLASRQQLLGGSDRTKAALDEARQRAETLGILAGTVQTTGPGIVLTVTDPQGTVRADVLLDALEELRDAGAEAIQLGSVRVVASTYIIDHPGGGIEADGQIVQPPYRFTVIGDARTLAAALDIPGGVLDTVRRSAGANGTVVERSKVTVSALHGLETPQYAHPAPAPSGG